MDPEPMPSDENSPNERLSEFPALPTELILQIFTSACTISHETALRTSLVAKWVRKECLPYIFATIIRRAGSAAAWGTNGMLPRGERGISHLLPPPGCGAFVKNLWIESIDMMSSPGELSIFGACPNLEDVALSAKSLRVLYTSITFDTGRARDVDNTCPGDMHADRAPIMKNAPPALHIRSLTLLAHTYRYDWHFLVGVEVQGGQAFLHNITHLRLLSMQQSAYVPIEHLPSLTHVALPYLHLRTNRAGDLLRLPDGILEKESLKMIVLTVDEREWLYKPWHHRGIPIGSAAINSPRERYRMILQHTKKTDPRLYVVLSPRLGRTEHEEWAQSARGGETLWEKALRLGQDESYADVLPVSFPATDLKFTTPMLTMH